MLEDRVVGKAHLSSFGPLPTFPVVSYHFARRMLKAHLPEGMAVPAVREVDQDSNVRGLDQPDLPRGVQAQGALFVLHDCVPHHMAEVARLVAQELRPASTPPSVTPTHYRQCPMQITVHMSILSSFHSFVYSFRSFAQSLAL